MKVILIGANFNNKGAESMIYSTKWLLDRFIGNTKITVITSKSHKYINTISVGYITGVSLLILLAILNKLPFINKLIKNNKLQAFIESDLIINISGFSLTDQMNLYQNLSSFLYVILCKIINKPHLIFPQDVGPFHSYIKRFLARITANYSKLIIVRSQESKNHLLNIGIKKEIYICSDLAFNFEPSSKEVGSQILKENNIKKNKKKNLCIIPNLRVYQNCFRNNFNYYTKELVNIIEFIRRDYDFNIILLPHEFRKDKKDDRMVIYKILEELDDVNCVFKIDKEYSAADLKAIINQMDIIICSRFHSAVAALSLKKPSLIIGWAHKYISLMSSVDYCYYVIDYKDLSKKKTEEKIKNLISNTTEIINHLNSVIPIIKNNALLPGHLLRDLIIDENN